MKECTDNVKKEPYQKPRLRAIELAADEVLAVGCKSAGGGFNVGATPCMANQCKRRGS